MYKRMYILYVLSNDFDKYRVVIADISDWL